MTTLNFDATNVPEQDSFDPLPPSWYNAVITDSEVKPTNAGTGSYLSLEFTILDGEYANRKVFTNLNLENPNPVAVEIAQKQLSSICHATGVIQVGESEELHDKPMQIKLSVRKANDEYDASNDVKAFKAIEGGAAAGASAGPTSAAPKKAAAPKKEAPVKAAPAKAAEPVYEMTEKADGVDFETFIADNWTPEEMVEQGYAVLVEAKAAPTKAAPKKAPVKAAAGGKTEDGKPPWAQG